MEYILPSIIIIFIFLSIFHSVKSRIYVRGGASEAKKQFFKNTEHEPQYTVLIPAYNEHQYIHSTIQSVENQTLQPSNIILLDDCSDQPYSEIASSFPNVQIIRSQQQRGKSVNINSALQKVGTPYVMVLDADTTLFPTYVRNLFSRGENFDVAYGLILSDFQHPSIYSYYRLVEHLYAHEITKKAMSVINALNITGCCVLYETESLKAEGGYPTRTRTEDLDLAWIMLETGKRIVYVEGSVAYSVDPSSFRGFSRQLHRWYGGFWETLRVHGGDVGKSNGLTFLLGIFLFDIIVFTPFWVAFLTGSLLLFLSNYQPVALIFTTLSSFPLIDMFTSLWQRWFPFANDALLAVISLSIDFVVLVGITLYKAAKLRCFKKALLGVPIFYFLNWYGKFVWLKCGIQNLLSRRSKETLTW